MMGLIHRWQFDGNGIDSMGNLSTTPIGPVAYTEVGNGQGVVFDGSKTAISLPPAKDMMFQESFSISVWANLYSRPPAGQMWSSIIFCGDDRPGLDPYALQVGPKGNIQFLVTGVNSTGSLDAPMPLKTFVFLTCTYDKSTGTQSLYQNAKLVNQAVGNKSLTPVVPLVPNENAGIGIGSNNGYPNHLYNFSWKGVISDLRIYNRSLSPAEVLALYHQGVTHTKTKINPINP